MKHENETVRVESLLSASPENPNQYRWHRKKSTDCVVTFDRMRLNFQSPWELSSICPHTNRVRANCWIFPNRLSDRISCRQPVYQQFDVCTTYSFRLPTRPIPQSCSHSPTHSIRPCQCPTWTRFGIRNACDGMHSRDSNCLSNLCNF